MIKCSNCGKVLKKKVAYAFAKPYCSKCWEKVLNKGKTPNNLRLYFLKNQERMEKK